MEASLPRFRRLAVSAQSFRRLALASAVILVLIVASGATVRLTGSGLGCDQWPGCQAGKVYPDTGYHSYVEFSNRVESGFVIFVTLATFLASLRVPGLERWVRWVAGAAFLTSLLQAPLGAVTVHYKLNPYLVGSHFLLSIVALTLGILVALEAWNIRGEPVTRGVRWLAMVSAVSCGALLFSGVAATAAGPHSGGTAVPRIWRLEPAVYVHVRATAIFALTFAALLVWLNIRGSRHIRGALIVLGLLVVQMVIGEIQYRTHLPLGLVIAHVTLSAVVWAATVVFVATLWRPSRMA
ncbi:MAG TPA: COX15/CtaA family protein [Gaiellaceae bacterium]|jgi:cytochrome c oxidase assembly protein subunit 15|nr:COX15/CtaA family protein [Gaiellaceae bacterium]